MIKNLQIEERKHHAPQTDKENTSPEYRRTEWELREGQNPQIPKNDRPVPASERRFSLACLFREETPGVKGSVAPLPSGRRASSSLQLPIPPRFPEIPLAPSLISRPTATNQPVEVTSPFPFFLPFRLPPPRFASEQRRFDGSCVSGSKFSVACFLLFFFVFLSSLRLRFLQNALGVQLRCFLSLFYFLPLSSSSSPFPREVGEGRSLFVAYLFFSDNPPSLTLSLISSLVLPYLASLRSSFPKAVFLG